MTASLYRRIPYLVEAMCLTEDNGDEVAAWCGGRYDRRGIYIEVPQADPYHYDIAIPGEYVVRGIHNEFYVVKPNHFEAGYQPINRKHQ